MASVPGRTGPLVLAASTPQTLVPDPSGSGAQHVVPSRGIVFVNRDSVAHTIQLRIGSAVLDTFQVAASTTEYWAGIAVILNGETMVVELTTAITGTAPNITASYMRTD